MKLGKDEKKEIEILLKEILKLRGFKGPRGWMYKTDEKIYITILYDVIAKSKRLVIRAGIKKYSYDNFFWEIMNMKDNEFQGKSFRANGAFTSPEIIIKKINHNLTEGYLDQLEDIVDEMIKAIDNFIQQNDINDYVFIHDDTQDGGDLLDGSILKCLAYCDIGQISKARDVARHRIENGDRGRFENEGKGFFEWVVCFNPN